MDTHPPASTHAPAVVAVVVTHNPGTWFEDALTALAAQDYPDLSVLVIDAASTDDPVPRVAGALPSAYVRRLDTNPGYGPAANDVLEVVSGAAYFLFLHDDVRLEPSAVRVLVEEALRSNAGIVGPKLVAWGAPDELLQVGMSVDKTGVPWSPVERRELDQEQHDRVRDVFWVPGACMLVRSDLFQALGGFDRAIGLMGEDLDLCWRAQVAGARVMVVPPARVEHLEAISTRRDTSDLRRLHAQHRLRTVLTCYGIVHLLRVLPQAAAVAAGETLYAIAIGQFERARDVAGGWVWNLRRLGEIVARHREVRSLRTVPDADVRRLQVRGSARLNAFLRGEIGAEDRMRALASAGRDLAGSFMGGARRRALVTWLLIALVLVAGSRSLLTGQLPAVGSLVPFPDDPNDLLGAYVSGYRSIGLGAEAPAPTAFGLLGAAGVLFVGAMGQLQKVVVLGLVPIGLLGAWRMVGHVRSPWARLTGLIAYAAVPLPYNALARGSWGGLVLYAAAPWILARLLRAARLAPFTPATAVAPDEESSPGEAGGPPVSTRRAALIEVVALGLVVAVAAAFVPATVLLVPVVALAVAGGTALAGARAAALRAVPVAAGASAVAIVLHFPWSLEFLVPGAEWTALGGVAPVSPHDLSMAALLRFETGPLGAGVLGWSFVAAAALPLLIGQGWRFGAAVQAWTVAAVSFLLAWVGGSDWLPRPLPAPEVMLAFAAAGLSLSIACGVAAFERDLRRAHFGWRQVASVAAALALAAGVLPVLGATVDGRWDAPDSGLSAAMGLTGEDAGDADATAFRVLWLGDAEVLPLSAWRLDDDLAFASSGSRPPDLRHLWGGAAGDTTGLMADAVRLAADGRTNRLGRLLAPLGVRYVVLAERMAPAGEDTPVHPLPIGLEATIADQLDLRRIEADPAVAVFENTAFAPVRAHVTDEQAQVLDATALFAAAVAIDLTGAEAVLTSSDGYARWQGSIAEGSVYVAEVASEHWELTVDGEGSERRKALGWANVFDVPDTAAGRAVLSYDTPLRHHGVVAVQVVLWLLAARLLLLAFLRRRRRLV